MEGSQSQITTSQHSLNRKHTGTNYALDCQVIAISQVRTYTDHSGRLCTQLSPLEQRSNLLFINHHSQDTGARHGAHSRRTDDVGEHSSGDVHHVAHGATEHHLRQEVGRVERRHVGTDTARRQRSVRSHVEVEDLQANVDKCYMCRMILYGTGAH